MTILSVCQDAAVELSGAIPTTLFSTTDTFALELRRQANKAAKAIAKAHDWRKLTYLVTLDGDGTTTNFTLPSDYDRMPLKSNVFLTSTPGTSLMPARDLDQWLSYQTTPVVGSPGCWIFLSGDMQILPAIGEGDSAQFYYQTNEFIAGNKTEFTADLDTYLLSEELLTLGIIWRWRASKRLEYAEDLKNFEIAFGEEAGRDKGSRLLAIGRARMPSSTDLAYPVAVGAPGQVTMDQD